MGAAINCLSLENMHTAKEATDENKDFSFSGI
jgi:hypothetical protein